MLLYDTEHDSAPPTTVLSFADATNAATAHPTLPLLAVAVGERSYPLSLDDNDDTDSGPVGTEAFPGTWEGSEGRPNGISIWRIPATAWSIAKKCEAE